MGNELWVALKEEWVINIMDTTLISGRRQGQIIEFSDKSKIITTEVGSS